MFCHLLDTTRCIMKSYLGDKAGLSSVRVNDKYRIEFEEHVEGPETIATIVNITELSNHYQ